jgi:fumarate reductase flavoprotein subunit
MSGGDISREKPPRIDAEAEVVVIGAGACGLVAALRAKAAGAEVIVLERDASPLGSTSMSSGFVPAPATRFQHAIGVNDDTPELFVTDIMAKSKGTSRRDIAELAAENISPAIEWLADHAGYGMGSTRRFPLSGPFAPSHARSAGKDGRRARSAASGRR